MTEGLETAFKQAQNNDVWVATKKTEKTESGFTAVFKAGEDRNVEYEKSEPDILESLLATLKNRRARHKFLVFDNFEQVSTNRTILEEIAGLIIRLDNPRFSKFGVRFLFVGVVSDMKELIAHFDNAGTVSNRLTEIPEVRQLSIEEAGSLVKRGLVTKLRISFEIEFDNFVDHILFLTNRNAQQLHEFCYEIACEARDNNWVITSESALRAEKDWIDTSLSLHTAQIESRMNKRQTKIQRRNQVLFCLGAAETNSFSPTQVEKMIRKLFPDKVSAIQLGVDQILSGLADGKNPILVQNPNDNSFRLAHPKLRLALRARLQELSERKPVSAKEVQDTLMELLNSLRNLEGSPNET